MTILVGCSGWSYDDWVGRFYPIGLAKKKGEWLSYYAQFFSTVEINSTYYHPPGERQVQSWIKKVKDREGGFEYSVKMPGLVTHQALVEGDEEKALFWTSTFDKTCLSPLADTNLLGGVLFQLSPHFKHEGQALDRLAIVLDSLAQKEYDLAVEFRHRSWLDEDKKEINPEASEVLRERNVANVLIDGPGFHFGTEQTADHSYIRFHGRNYDIWYKDEKEDDHRLDRYDYLYKKEQLEPWVPRIKEVELKTAKVRMFFNNHARAKAVRNAFQMMDMLLIEHKSKEIHLQDQFTLGEFGE
jgi:uncharacterized protein YecE (DUF72 family)